jgi:hypothetical protein
MRVRDLSLSLVVAAGLVGCGDDDNNNNPDARPIDGPDKPTFGEYDADEGGEVRIEYVRFGGGNAAARVTAVLFDNPGTKRFFPFLDANGCTDTSLKEHWPTAENPVAERTYLDPGKVLISGGPQVLDIPRKTVEGRDVPGRTHPANKWFQQFGGGMANDAALYLPEKRLLDVTFTGSDDMPGQIFDNVVYMPADFEVLDPPLSTMPHPIPAGQPQTFTWTTPAQDAPPGFEIMSLVAFIAGGNPLVICLEKNDGSITVPANMIDIVRAKAPTGGTLARQTLTHVVRELVDRNGPTGKRIDILGIWCYATPFAVP